MYRLCKILCIGKVDFDFILWIFMLRRLVIVMVIVVLLYLFGSVNIIEGNIFFRLIDFIL